MRKNILAFLLSCLSSGIFAQTATQYVFARTTGTPATITGGAGTTASTAISDDDLTMTGVPIGFDFTFCGTTYTSHSACSNGWMSLSNSGSVEYGNSAGNVQGAGFLMPFWDDLDGWVGSATVYYQTSGTAPNRVYTFQWGGAGALRWGNLTGSGRAFWQVKLYESSNVLQYLYLTGNYSGNSATIGIANSTSDFRTLASATATSSVTTFSTGVAASPAANSVMTWTPPPTISATPSSLVFTTGASTTTTGLDVNLKAYGLTSGTVTVNAPANFQVYNGSSWVSSMTVSTVSAALGTYINTNIPVRFVGPATIGSYTGNLTFTSTGATTVNVALTGNVTPPCSGMPTPGTVSASVTSGSCTPYVSNMSLVGATAAAGITYQWQSSPNNITWTDISGATNATYSPTISMASYYRCQLTCTSLTASTPGVFLNYNSCIVMPGSGSTSVTSCGSSFYDPGGPSGDYADDQTSVTTIFPGATGTGSKVSVTFTSFDIEEDYEYLSVYNGSTVGSPLLGTFTGTSLPPTLTSTAANGALTFEFTSDGSVTYSGFVATITNTNPNPITAHPAASTSVCQGGTIAARSVTASGTNTYQWYSNTTNANSGGTAIPSATASTYVPPTTTVGTLYYYCVVTNACVVPFASNTSAVIVNPPPAAIAGPGTVCEASTITLTNPTVVAGSTWSSSLPATGSVNSTSGVVGGIAAGTTRITYTLPTGCFSTTVVTVNALPSAITGAATVCAGSTTTLNSTPAGTWSSDATDIATVAPVSGVVTGSIAGVAGMSYTIPGGCIRTILLSVNPVPAITVSPSSTPSLCMGDNVTVTANATVADITLLSQNFNSGLGNWTISNLAGVAGSYWQIVSSPGLVAGDGSPMLQANTDATGGPENHTIITSPSFSTVGYTSAYLSFNQYLLSAVPDIAVVVEYSLNGGSTWLPLHDQLYGIDGSGSWTAAVPQVSVPFPAPLLGQPDVRLRWNYDAFAYSWVIDNIAVKTLAPAPGYSWVGAAGLSCTACAAPVITPATTGANVYTVTAAASGCSSSQEVTVTANAVAGAVTVTGGGTFCGNTTINASGGAGGTIYFQGTTSGGTSIATSATSAPITASGTYYFRARTAAGCWGTEGSVAVVINPMPGPVTGPSQVCYGATITLGNTETGGTWSSDAVGVATVTSTGVVTGVNPGTATIIYTLTGGCNASQIVTVNELPAAIGGSLQVCEESVTMLTDATADGTWSIAPVTTATVSTTGAVTGIAAGNAAVVYTLPTGCSVSATVTVNSTPAPITGIPQMCEGGTTLLSTSTVGGAWGSSASATASVDAGGLVSGHVWGTADIIYTLGSCTRSVTVTVNALPGAITGDLEICVGAAAPLNSLPAGGTWISDAPGNAAIGLNTGELSGAGAGNANITYTLPTGCRTIAVATVDPLPAMITGVNVVCENGATTLYDFTPDGTWSSLATATATVNPATGVVTGMAAGVTDIYYTLATGCFASTQLTVDPLPAALTGSDQVCHGDITVLSSTSPDGTWQSSASGTADVDASGNVTGVSPGTAVVTYTLPTGCFTTRGVTVNALPAAIAGPDAVCVNGSITLTNASAGGTWSSLDATVGVDGTAGTVTGVSDGTATVTYTLPAGCYVTAIKTVNPLPVAIAGPGEVCEEASITLTNSDPDGTWSSADGDITVGASTGIVTGVSAGTAVVTYTLPTTCAITTIETVNGLPSVATGATQVCVGETTVLSSTPTNGTWSSLDVGIVSVGTAGSVFGVADGTATITYTLLTGCTRTTLFTVKPLPAAITGMAPVCEGFSVTLSNATAGGTWQSDATGIATVSSTGTLTGIDDGNANITYTSALGCIATAVATVNALPAAITGVASVCRGLTTDLDNATVGGTWSSSADAIASVDADGLVTGVVAGTASISYIMGTGCYAVVTATVNQLPTAITGNMQVCVGLSNTLGSTPLGGTWMSDATSIADIGINNGSLSGIDAGTAGITYTLPTGCITTATATVNALPPAITGITEACSGAGTTLSNTDGTGTWGTSAASIADIDASGNVTGMSDGVATITYTLPNTCVATTTYTVHPLPTAFTGGTQVCEGLSHTLGNTLAGGTWESSDPAIADITTGGLLSGVLAGTADITYTLATGCSRIETATVNAAVPAITGTAVVCAGLTTTLANDALSGSWQSSNIAVATVDASGGVVTGVNAGTAVITYLLPTGCLNTTIATVNALPAPITGVMSVCAGQTTTLHNITTPGTWSGGVTGIASIDATGLVTSTAAGSASFTYTLPTGCLRSATVVVNALPEVQTVTGGGSYCAGSTGVHIGLANSAGATTYKIYNGSTLAGTITSAGGVIDFGSYTMAGTYTVNATTVGTGCFNAMAGSPVVSITPLVTPSVSILSGHGDTMCAATSNTFTAIPVNGGSTPTYTWSVNGLAAGTGSVFVYTPANGDVIKVTHFSSEACPSPASVSTTRVMSIIDNQTPTIGVTKTSGDTTCQFLAATFDAITTWAGDAPVFTWFKGVTPIGTGESLSYIPSNGDVITCRLTSNYRCRTITTVTSPGVTLSVDSLYIPAVAIEASPGLTIRPGTVATLTATASGAGPSPRYEWLINGVSVPGPNSPVLKSAFAHNDVVTCIVYGTGVCGKVSFNEVTMTIDENAPTDVAHISTQKSDVKLMPNPNNGTFSVKGKVTGTNEVTLEVTNMLGQSVFRKNVQVPAGSIEEQITLGNALANGMYLFSITSGSDRQTMHFVMKR